MKSKDIIIINKMIKYVDELNEFIEGYSKEQFIQDKKTINASVFNLSQIGELANKVSDELITENSSVEWKGLKGLRNRIVHDYDGINLNMIWDFLETELNDLKNKLKEILKKSNE